MTPTRRRAGGPAALRSGARSGPRTACRVGELTGDGDQRRHRRGIERAGVERAGGELLVGRAEAHRPGLARTGRSRNRVFDEQLGEGGAERLGHLADTIDDAWIHDETQLGLRLDQYISERDAARNAFDARYNATIFPTENRWEEPRGWALDHAYRQSTFRFVVGDRV